MLMIQYWKYHDFLWEFCTCTHAWMEVMRFNIHDNNLTINFVVHQLPEQSRCCDKCSQLYGPEWCTLLTLKLQLTAFGIQFSRAYHEIFRIFAVNSVHVTIWDVLQYQVFGRNVVLSMWRLQLWNIMKYFIVPFLDQHCFSDDLAITMPVSAFAKLKSWISNHMPSKVWDKLLIHS